MNFAELQSEVASWLNRTDLTSSIPTFIRLAQWDIERGIPIMGVPIPNRGLWNSMKVFTTGSTLTASNQYLSHPTRYRETRLFHIYTGGVYYEVIKKPLDFVLLVYPLTETDPLTSRPRYFASDQANSRFVFVPTPDQAYSYVHEHWAFHAELSNIVLGADKVTNGNFSVGTDWTLGSGWAIGSGTLNHTAGNTATASQETTEAAAEVYKVIFTVSARTAGTVTVSIGGVAGTSRDSNETFTEYITATGTGNLTFTPTTDFNGSIDNVQVFLATGGTNWWTTNAWNVLLYGALCKAAPYLNTDPRLSIWKDEFKNAIDGLASTEIHEEYSGFQNSRGGEIIV